MNDFLFKFFQGLFNEDEPNKVRQIVNELTYVDGFNFSLPYTLPQTNPIEPKDACLLASTIYTLECDSAIALRGVFDMKRQAFWVAKGDTLIKITGAPFLIAKRYLHSPETVKEKHGLAALERSKILQMHLNKIANYLDLAEVSGLYTEIYAPESDTAFLKVYSGIPYQ